MLRWLILREFKAFAGEHRIRLAPLTLIFGKNSAGKSSIIQSILFLKQSATALASGAEAKWVGDAVDLGSMEHALYGQGRDPNHETLTVGAIARLSLRAGDDGPEEAVSGQSFAPGKTYEQAVGVEFSWTVRETRQDDSTRPAPPRWAIYEAEETHPIIRGSDTWRQHRPRRRNREDDTEQIVQTIEVASPVDGRRYGIPVVRQSAQARDRQNRRLQDILYGPPAPNLIRRGPFTFDPYPPNPAHPRIGALYAALSGPLADAFRRNLEAWAQIVKKALVSPECRAVAEPLARYWRLAEGLGDLIDLRWLDPRLVETDLRRRAPRRRRPSAVNTAFDPALLGPRVWSWFPQGVHDVDWVDLRTILHNVADEYARTLPARDSRQVRTWIEGLVTKAIWIKKQELLLQATSPRQSNVDMLREWCSLIEYDTHNSDNQIKLKIILQENINAYSFNTRTIFISNSDLDYLYDDIYKVIDQYSVLSPNMFFLEICHFLHSARETGWKGRGSDEGSLSDHILDHADKYRTIGIPEDIAGYKWYEPGFLENLRDLENDVSHLARLQLQGPLSRVTHVKGIRPQLRRTYEGLTQSAGAAAGEVEPTRALASRLNSEPRLVEKVNGYMEFIGLPYTLEVRVVSNTIFPISSHAFYLRDVRNQALLGMQDVGFGVGQLIPVLAELAATTGGVLLLEQPELHLHPKMQAELGQLLATAVQEREGFQIVAETHSEHMILRLMRLVREGKLAHDLIQILYVDQNEKGEAQVTELPLDKDGEFEKNWPDGFFDERLNEL